jgi:hypothetical protein
MTEMLSFILVYKKEVCRKTSTVPLRLQILVPPKESFRPCMRNWWGQQKTNAKWSPLQNSRAVCSNAVDRLKMLQVLCINKQGHPDLLTPKSRNRKGEVGRYRECVGDV